MNLFLYITTVLIWGSTWIAIHFQLGDTPILSSIFFRFAIAGGLLLPIVFVCRRLQPTHKKDHLFFLLQGGCLFSINFVCFYNATQYITSGLVSVVFSMATLYNALNNWWIWKEKPSKKVYLAGSIGMAGLALLFWRELSSNTFSINTAIGLILAATGTYLFSLGNMISLRNNRRGLTPLTTNAYAMVYGAVFLFVMIIVSGTPMRWDTRPIYLYSLVYLAIPGTIIGFTTYLMLVSRIGANNAAYTTVMFPIVALSLSAIYEGYQWTPINILGLALALSGNLILQFNTDKIRRLKPPYKKTARRAPEST